MTVIGEEKKYRELKENIRTINSQRSDAEKISWLKKVKKLLLRKLLIAIKLNSLKHKYGIYIHIKMKSCCLKCKKIYRKHKSNSFKNE